MKAVTLQRPPDATHEDLRDALACLFPDAGRYEIIKASTGVRHEVAFSAPVALAGDPAAIWDALFPERGRYLIKATAEVEAGGFEEWWLERLVTAARTQFEGVHGLVRRAIAQFLEEHRAALVDPGSFARFEQLLFDVSRGIRWSVAAPVSHDVERQLRAMGWAERELLDFPGLAYRLGMLHQVLARPGASLAWDQVLELARAVPLTPVDQAAIAIAREQAARALTPVLLRDGRAAQQHVLDHEMRTIRERVAQAVERGTHPAELARQLYKEFDRDGGIVRDWERVARTEINEARCRGALTALRTARGLDDDSKVYRLVARDPCTACLRLYVTAEGMPRLYAIAELEREDAQGYNTGPHATWHARVGPTHPNCLCGPWLAYTPGVEAAFQMRAEVLRRLRDQRRIAA